VTSPPAASAVRFLGAEYVPRPEPPGRRPALYVVVDTEAEFDWGKPFARDLVRVSAMAAQERAQAIFDRHGLRPIYVVDYPVASQPEGFVPLLAILRRGGCEIGAHLHPWTNPPFEESVSLVNSFPGNLAPETEEAKFAALLAAIRRNFGVFARFYKSGRFGIGPNTVPMLVRHGVGVDFSILPGADLRATGGPDFRAFRPIPYLTAGGEVLSLPMTRGYVGPLAALEGPLNRMLDRGPVRMLKARGALSRAGLLNRVTLTPEGMSAARQIALIETLYRQGCRSFVLSYHSPSLVPGHTAYVRTEQDVQRLLGAIEAVCRYFLGPLGGEAGDPRALTPTPAVGAADALREAG
jgi:hypothetical protein